MSNTQYLSAHDRLRELPPVFLSADLSMRYGWRSQMTAAYLSRWKKQGLIRPLGGRSGVYFNLVADPIWEKHLEGAIRLAMPSAIEIGAAPLHEGGITTQRAYVRDLALPYEAPAYTIEGFQNHERGIRWFKAIHPHVIPGEMPRLTPVAALADILTSQDPKLWMPDPDDIDFDILETQDLLLLENLVNQLGGANEIHWDPALDPEENYEQILHARMRAAHHKALDPQQTPR